MYHWKQRRHSKQSIVVSTGNNQTVLKKKKNFLSSQLFIRIFFSPFNYLFDLFSLLPQIYLFVYLLALLSSLPISTSLSFYSSLSQAVDLCHRSLPIAVLPSADLATVSTSTHRQGGFVLMDSLCSHFSLTAVIGGLALVFGLCILALLVVTMGYAGR